MDLVFGNRNVGWPFQNRQMPPPQVFLGFVLFEAYHGHSLFLICLLIVLDDVCPFRREFSKDVAQHLRGRNLWL